jgi:hypothetical protein
MLYSLVMLNKLFPMPLHPLKSRYDEKDVFDFKAFNLFHSFA